MARSAARRERVRLNKAAERQRRRAIPSPTTERSYHNRRECITTYCGEQLTSPLHRMRCKHRVCEHCIKQQLRRDINRNQFCFRLCAGYLPAQIYARLRNEVMAESFRPWMGAEDLASPSETEVQRRRGLLRSKRVQIGDRICQDFTVQYTSDGSQRTCSRKQTFYGKVLSVTDEVHLRVRWERSEFDDESIRDPFGLVPIRAVRRCKNQTAGSFQ